MGRVLISMEKEGYYINIGQLVPGLFVDLELNWSQHPFLFSKFKVKNTSDVSEIKSLGLKRLKIIQSKSDADALTLSSKTISDDDAPATVNKEIDDPWKNKQQSVSKAEQYRLDHRKAAQKYRESEKRIHNLARNLAQAPANAIRDADDVISDLTSLLEGSDNIVVSLVNLPGAEFNINHHALNVTVLALMLGHHLELSKSELHSLGIGSILHDIGKIMLPKAIVNKTSPLSNPEKEILKTHVGQGLKLMSRIGGFSNQVTEIVAHHHSYLDGTGYPKTKNPTEISTLCRITSITNHYDGMCNPAIVANALSPKIAMAKLFSVYKTKLDIDIVQIFVRNFGVYPPGTIVELNDDSIALVVAVDSDSLLSPRVLVYNPDIPANKALFLDLAEHEDIKISKALKTGEYPQRVNDYLGLKERAGYYLSQSK